MTVLLGHLRVRRWPRRGRKEKTMKTYSSAIDRTVCDTRLDPKELDAVIAPGPRQFSRSLTATSFFKQSRFAIVVLFVPSLLGQVEPEAGTWKTWIISSARDYRVPPPPDA